uniref:Uncharacterized protein n=1 Tax=Vespula pensylvanica TaxID=30213 RepID=A0A834NXT7_VESPE|nr:hypothetical protein H0235_010862 [Vespula pensylvanica]
MAPERFAGLKPARPSKEESTSSLIVELPRLGNVFTKLSASFQIVKLQVSNCKPKSSSSKNIERIFKIYLDKILFLAWEFLFANLTLDTPKYVGNIFYDDFDNRHGSSHRSSSSNSNSNSSGGGSGGGSSRKRSSRRRSGNRSGSRNPLEEGFSKNSRECKLQGVQGGEGRGEGMRVGVGVGVDKGMFGPACISQQVDLKPVVP